MPNNARIAPGARVDDGRLDLVVIPPVGWLSICEPLNTGAADKGRRAEPNGSTVMPCTVMGWPGSPTSTRARDT